MSFPANLKQRESATWKFAVEPDLSPLFILLVFLALAVDDLVVRLAGAAAFAGAHLFVLTGFLLCHNTFRA